MSSSKQILANVLAAMQPAEELGGPAGTEYVSLMEKIATEASLRAQTCRTNLMLDSNLPTR
jgi:hypothetical protein